MLTIKNIVLGLLTCFLMLWMIGCKSRDNSGFFPLTAAQSRSLIERNAGDPDFVVLDVRTPVEFQQGHIAGAVLLDYHRSDFSSRLKKLDRAKTYLLYCHTGYRSSKTLALMEEMGFQSVYHLQRGIVEWYAGKLPLTRP